MRCTLEEGKYDFLSDEKKASHEEKCLARFDSVLEMEQCKSFVT
jgi:hypothetical protein